MPEAKISAASKAVDEGVLLKAFLTSLFGTRVQTLVIVDFKELYHALLPKQNTTDKSIRRDVNLIIFFFETDIDISAWIPGNLNLADAGTKLDSQITEPLLRALATGVLQIELTNCELNYRDKSFG